MANSPKQLGALSLDRATPYVKPKVKQDRPAYGVINDGFFDENDKFWHPGQMLYFTGEPNQNLHPLNKLAYDKIQGFLDKIDLLGMEVAEKSTPKKKYIPQPRQEWKEEEDIDLPQIENVMGVPKNAKNDEIR